MSAHDGFGYHPPGTSPHPYDDPAIQWRHDGPRHEPMAGVNPVDYRTYEEYQERLGAEHYHVHGRPTTPPPPTGSVVGGGNDDLLLLL